MASVSTSLCRICHEEEEEASTSMETPCACSGTLKYAHRRCVQRWIDEKGNTTCEICLQKFEPVYTAPPKKTRLADVPVTIRGSLEVPRLNPELYNPGLMAIVASPEEGAEADADCSPPSERSACCFRSIAVILTIFLLTRHFIALLTGGQDQYAFTLFTLFVLRAGGIVVPLYIIMRSIEAVRLAQLQYWLREGNASVIDHEEVEEPAHHTIQID